MYHYYVRVYCSPWLSPYMGVCNSLSPTHVILYSNGECTSRTSILTTFTVIQRTTCTICITRACNPIVALPTQCKISTIGLDQKLSLLVSNCKSQRLSFQVSQSKLTCECYTRSKQRFIFSLNNLPIIREYTKLSILWLWVVRSQVTVNSQELESFRARYTKWETVPESTQIHL